jgi:hypothetical protein
LRKKKEKLAGVLHQAVYEGQPGTQGAQMQYEKKKFWSTRETTTGVDRQAHQKLSARPEY